MPRPSRWRQSRFRWLVIALFAAIGLAISYTWQVAFFVLAAISIGALSFAFGLIDKRRTAEIEAQEQRARLEGLVAARLDVVDQMTGEEFEDLVAGLLEILGYRADVTQRSRDGGADVLAQKDGERIAIQVKRYRGSVGIKAVQEAIGGMYGYQCASCMVITNSFYSRDAIDLAAKSPCILVDRDGLVDMIARARSALESGPSGG